MPELVKNVYPQHKQIQILAIFENCGGLWNRYRE